MADYVVLQGIDVLALIETRLVADTDQFTINELVRAGYEFNHNSRNTGRRSGFIIIIYTS